VKNITCIVCNNKLPPRRSRFCSRICVEFHDSIKRRKNTLRLRLLLMPRKCISCGSMFQPNTERHTSCSKVCRDIIVSELKRKRRVEDRKNNVGNNIKGLGGTTGSGNRSRKVGKYSKSTVTNIPRRFVDSTTFTRADTEERIELQSKVEEYLANGGKILKYGAQPAIVDKDSMSTWGVSEIEEDKETEKYKIINAHNGN